MLVRLLSKFLLLNRFYSLTFSFSTFMLHFSFSIAKTIVAEFFIGSSYAIVLYAITFISSSFIYDVDLVPFTFNHPSSFTFIY